MTAASVCVEKRRREEGRAIVGWRGALLRNQQRRAQVVVRVGSGGGCVHAGLRVLRPAIDLDVVRALDDAAAAAAAAGPSHSL